MRLTGSLYTRICAIIFLAMSNFEGDRISISFIFEAGLDINMLASRGNPNVLCIVAFARNAVYSKQTDVGEQMNILCVPVP